VSRDQLQVYLDEFVFPPQPTAATHGRVPNPARPRDRPQAYPLQGHTWCGRSFQA
jgi:hypothetical protein